MKNNYILILNFGGQYNQLLARRVRECGVYCEIYPYNKAKSAISEKVPDGIIFTGGPRSVYSKSSPKIFPEIFDMNIPILGICYGAQMMAHMLGGKVETAANSETGKTTTNLNFDATLFKSMESPSITWMSHRDIITTPPENFSVTASCEESPVAAMECNDKKLYATQFHPEVSHTQNGSQIIKNFLFDVCGCKAYWSIQNYLENIIEDIKEEIKDKKVLLALSGGVDSSVVAALLSKAVGNQLTAIFVDHGLMRKDEGNEIEEVFSKWDLNFKRINAQEYFLDNLKGIENPEEKRKIIGESFIRIFEKEAKKIGQVDYFAQGTIYPDLIESGQEGAALIKSHHNVGGLPEKLEFKHIIEPLQKLFKDEVRDLGLALGLPSKLIYRQPFPGPGLGIRIIGDVTQEKLNILRESDFILRQEIEKSKLASSINQYFTVLTSMRSVGVMGDVRTYDYTLAIRAVTTTDFMTADFAKIPYDILEKISTRIVNTVKNVNRIVYDITTKPPATIEWE